MRWSARIAQRDYEQLLAYLHPGDDDEHAAFLYAGEMTTREGHSLLVRRVVPVAHDDFGPSDRGGYRQVAAHALARAAIECEAEGMRLLWAHSHPGAVQHVGFSKPDLATHARAHPHMINMTGGGPVASLVLGTASVAGEVWLPGGTVTELDHLDVVGARTARLTAAPLATARTSARFARQVLMFGAEGQARLRSMTVAVVGAGGGGSLLVQSLAHLGVGRIIIIDFDRVDITNLSRIVGATPKDARRRRLKVDVLRRLVRSIDPDIHVVAVAGDITCAVDARALLAADYVFSARDTHFARFAVNAICHQYLIPGAQVGGKVVTGDDGAVQLAYAMHRPIDLGGACLECGGAIDPDALRREQLDDVERGAQAYVNASVGDDIVDPSVITLNSAAVAMAMLDFQFSTTACSPRARGSRSASTTRPSGHCVTGKPRHVRGAGGATGTPSAVRSREETIIRCPCVRDRRRDRPRAGLPNAFVAYLLRPERRSTEPGTQGGAERAKAIEVAAFGSEPRRLWSDGGEVLLGLIGSRRGWRLKATHRELRDT